MEDQDVTSTAEYEKAKQTPPTEDSRAGDRVRITIEKTVQATWRGRGPDGAVLLGEFGGWDHYLVPGDGREVVNVEIIEPARPAFKNGDVVRSTAYPRNIAVRHNSRWRWTDDVDSLGWDDGITADHLDSGYKTAIRVGGEAA